MTCLSPPITRTFLALVSVYEREGRATVRSVAEAAGRRSWSSTHSDLCRLRADGLVAWDEGTRGSLRPLYGTVRREK